MDGTTALDTRARILETALDLFSGQGYQRTSMREIAERLGLTKAAVFYHFPSKAHLLAALSEPLTEDVEESIRQALDEAAVRPDPDRARWVMIEYVLDAYLRHRRLLRVLMHDLTLLAHDHAFQRFVGLIEQVHQIVAGPDPDLRRGVRAVQAIAMISDPVMFFPDVPDERIRAEILAGVRTLLAPAPDGPPSAGPPGPPGPPAPPPRPARRRAGRPSVMDGDKGAQARRMYAAGTHSVTEIAAALGVSRATVYRHLAGS
ncbi:DNA-binding transcriptional regulator, AcrR family [Thermomonospora echinospora]|uniref:DNA-binding transcriptional regulator, AcrR family n=1 Tax=Thermomonospora echinospora TaxID=1992 RepID=A0A1H6C7T5_9ACTN|nr:TetR family transcriptional regulator [Thermomonospora echinospora]SEG68963.1 DNA-binding transcriptional regulator, AcrR family [Thermomonospora echinospora]